MFDEATNVALVVADQERALAFYTETLGFEKRQDYQAAGRPRWLTVAVPGQTLEIILVRATYEVDPRPPRGSMETGGNHWVFETDDCRADYERLRRRGVTFKGAGLVEAPFGIAAYFTDPDGNHLTLLQPAKDKRKS